MIAEVSIRCQKKPRRLVYSVYPRIPRNTPLRKTDLRRLRILSQSYETADKISANTERVLVVHLRQLILVSIDRVTNASYKHAK